MRWNSLILCLNYVFPLCLAFGFDSTAVATNNFSLITSLSSTSTQCGGCNVYAYLFEFLWAPEILTHTAATIVKFVNNATNVTRTSTIHANDFVLPSRMNYWSAKLVSELVITTEMGGVEYKLTYPTQYPGVGYIKSETQSLVTDSDGNLQCVTSTAYMERNFLKGQYPSIDGMYSSIMAGCKSMLVSPPSVLVPVLSLTETETNYESVSAPKTSAVGKASPSKPIIAPTVTPTSTLKTVPRTPPQTVRKTPTIDSRPTSSKISLQTTSNVDFPHSSLPSPQSQSISRAPVSTNDRPPTSKVIVSDSQPVRFNSENVETPVLSSAIASPESAIPSSSETPSKPSATPRILATSSQPTPQLLLPIGSSFISANLEGNLVIADQTSPPDGPPITPIEKSVYLPTSETAAVYKGNTVSLVQAPAKPSDLPPPATLPIGSTVISEIPEGDFVIAGQTLTPGGAPVSALGKSIYLQPSRSAAIIDGSTVPLAQTPQILKFGTQALEKEKAGGFVIGSQTLVPGEAPITVAGTRFSLAPSASALIIGSSTIISKASPQVLTFGAEALTENSAGEYVVGSQTLIPGDAPITIAGSRFFLAPSASALIIDSQTLTQNPTPTLLAAIITQVTITENTQSEYLIEGQTLIPGAPPISIAGEPVSLARGESNLVIGSSTKSLSSEKSGLASLILNGFGDVRPKPAPPTGLNATTSSAKVADFTGNAIRERPKAEGGFLIGLSFIIMGLGMRI